MVTAAASIPLIIDTIVAIATTKLPILVKRGRALLLAASLVGVSACGGAVAPSSATTPASLHDVKVSLFDVDCAECAGKVVAEIRKDGTVYASSFDKKHVVLDVKVAAAITPEVVVLAAKRAGFRAEVGDNGGAYARQAAAPAGADIATSVDDGRDVPVLTSLLVAGKMTIIDFYADWCGPCRDVDAHVKDILATRHDVAYRRLNVVDWDTPLAAHYMKTVPKLPYVVIYDAAGTQIDAIAGLNLPRLDAALAKARP